MKSIAENYIQEIKSICKNCSIISFCIGTSILLMFLISKNDATILLGLYFTIIAIGINSLLLLLNITCASFNKNYRIDYMKNSGLLLINAPIAFLYFKIVLEICGF